MCNILKAMYVYYANANRMNSEFETTRKSFKDCTNAIDTLVKKFKKDGSIGELVSKYFFTGNFETTNIKETFETNFINELKTHEEYSVFLSYLVPIISHLSHISYLANKHNYFERWLVTKTLDEFLQVQRNVFSEIRERCGNYDTIWLLFQKRNISDEKQDMHAYVLENKKTLFMIFKILQAVVNITPSDFNKKDIIKKTKLWLFDNIEDLYDTLLNTNEEYSKLFYNVVKYDWIKLFDVCIHLINLYDKEYPLYETFYDETVFYENIYGLKQPNEDNLSNMFMRSNVDINIIDLEKIQIPNKKNNNSDENSDENSDTDIDEDTRFNIFGGKNSDKELITLSLDNIAYYKKLFNDENLFNDLNR